MPMSWLIPFDICVFFVLVTLLRSQFRSYVNYASLFVGVWVLIISISRLGLYDTYVASHLTYTLMYITLFVFVLTTYCLRSYERRRNQNYPTNGKTSIKALDLSRLSYAPLIVLALFTSILLMTYLPDALSILASGGFNSVRHNVLYSETSTYSSASLVFLKWAVNPLILVEYMISVAALVLKRVKRGKAAPVLLLLLSCANLFMYTLIFAGRWLLMEAMLFLVLLLLHQHGLRLWELVIHNKAITLVGFLAVVAILGISSVRTIGGTDVLTSVYVYFVGAVDMLDVLVSDPGYAQFGNVLFGAYTLDGLLSPLYVVFNRLVGTDIPFAINKINAVSSIMVSISPELHMNNNCTYVYGVLRDFGAAGLLIGPAILAVVCCKAYSYYERSGSDYGLILYLYMVVVLLFMVIEWMFGRVNVVYTAIYLYLIMRFCSVREPRSINSVPDCQVGVMRGRRMTQGRNIG